MRRCAQCPSRRRWASGVLHCALCVATACATVRAPDPPPHTESSDAFERALHAFAADAAAGRFGHIDQFVLLQNGTELANRSFSTPPKLASHDAADAAQQYDYDAPQWHPYLHGTELHTVQSITKSVTAICIGIALDKGHIPGGLDTPAMDWFAAYAPDLTDARRAAITLEDLLTMRSGIDWNESIPYTDPANSCIALESSDDWIQHVVDSPMREAPGVRFDYNSGASVLLGKIVREATGQRIDDFAREHLFEPLGIDTVYWKETPRGEIDTEGGLYLRADDLARIGQLMLDRGEWNEQRIVSGEWIDASVHAHVPELDPVANTGAGYGYQWWLPAPVADEPFVYAASGYGGQFVVVVPERSVVAVLTAWNHRIQPELFAAEAFVTRLLPTLPMASASDRP